MKVLSILWYEWIIFSNRFWGITLGLLVAPMLYLIAFGWGIGGSTVVNGSSYLSFVIPGIIAMSSMTTSFGTIANNINISRTYDKTFEEFMTAPINMGSFAIGKITAGALRGMYAAALIIVICLIFRADIQFDLYASLMVVLNCLVFSALGFMIGIIIESHADMSKFQNFIITPMSFLCGTFFPLDRMPMILKELIWILPLTQSSIAIRRDSDLFINMWVHPLIMIGYFLILLYIGVKLCKKAE